MKAISRIVRLNCDEVAIPVPDRMWEAIGIKPTEDAVVEAYMDFANRRIIIHRLEEPDDSK